jgi:hypothetical protein
MPVNVLQKAAERHLIKYPFISTILAMLKENPPSLSNILEHFPENGSFSLDERNNISSYRFKM